MPPKLNSAGEVIEYDNPVPNTTYIYKVSVKYAPFNRDDPEIWFTQLEAQFELGGIKIDGTKYGHLIAALDSETIKCVRDKVLDPPDDEKYASLKLAIIKRLCDSQKIKLNRLLSGLQLGDKKPSQLLREMQALSAKQLNDEILQNLWLQRLPTHTQEILSCMEELSLEKLAKAADKIVEVQNPVGIYSVEKVSVKDSRSAAIRNLNSELKLSIDALTKRFDSFFNDKNKDRNNKPSFEKNQTRSRSKSRSDKRANDYPNCWYHFKFGAKAKNCVKPCKFSPSNNESGNC